jgi:hypothetical protein
MAFFNMQIVTKMLNVSVTYVRILVLLPHAKKSQGNIITERKIPRIFSLNSDIWQVWTAFSFNGLCK